MSKILTPDAFPALRGPHWISPYGKLLAAAVSNDLAPRLGEGLQTINMICSREDAEHVLVGWTRDADARPMVLEHHVYIDAHPIEGGWRVEVQSELPPRLSLGGVVTIARQVFGGIYDVGGMSDGDPSYNAAAFPAEPTPEAMLKGAAMVTSALSDWLPSYDIQVCVTPGRVVWFAEDETYSYAVAISTYVPDNEEGFTGWLFTMARPALADEGMPSAVVASYLGMMHGLGLRPTLQNYPDDMAADFREGGLEPVELVKDGVPLLSFEHLDGAINLTMSDAALEGFCKAVSREPKLAPTLN